MYPNASNRQFYLVNDYFSKFYASEPDPVINATNNMQLKVEQSSHKNLQAVLNKVITVEEIKEAIFNLKNGKSPGIDMIMNEMLKSAKDILATPIAKIFNLNFDSNLYTAQWSKNVLTPLLNGGALDGPDNYRGISVSSCFAKLYGAVLNELLIDATDKSNLISQE